MGRPHRGRQRPAEARAAHAAFVLRGHALRGRRDRLADRGGGAFPPRRSAADPAGFASAALGWDLEIPAGGSRDVVIAVPLSAGASLPEPPLEASADFDARAALIGKELAREARARLLRPAGGRPADRAHGAREPRLDPGQPRRAGDPAGLALLRALVDPRRRADVVRRSCASATRTRCASSCSGSRRTQFESGAVPVLRRPPRRRPRARRTTATASCSSSRASTTASRRTAATLETRLAAAREGRGVHRRACAQSRRTEEYRTRPKAIFFGLLPESISHEGYSDQPVHSYWDDFWAHPRPLRRGGARGGAGQAGGRGALRGFARRDAPRTCTRRSAPSIAARGLDYIPGSADLGDFDPTSTTIALEPCGEGSRLPQTELAAHVRGLLAALRRAPRRTARRGASTRPTSGASSGSLVRLGRPRPRRARSSRSSSPTGGPAAWNHWAEVVWPRPARAEVHRRHAARLGRLGLHPLVPRPLRLRPGRGRRARPRRRHPGVLARATRAAPPSRGCARATGLLDLAFSAEGGGLRVHIGGGATRPPGGFVVTWPFPGRPSSATVNGKPAPISGAGEVVVRTVPAEVIVK